MKFQERAEPLLAHGFSIIPCEPRGKKPLHSPADPTRDPAIVAAWAERWPDANVGVVADENFCILDVDDVNAFLLQVSNLPETFTVRSSEGKVHCYLRKNGFEVRNQNFHPIGSLRADNFYCVGPESIHPDGHRYQVVKDVPVAELDPVLYRVLQQKAETMKRERENRFKNAPGDIIVRDGEGRHEFLTSRGSKLHNGEKDEDQLFEELWAINEKHCSPPVDEGWVRRFVNDWLVKKEPFVEPPQVIFSRSEPVNPDDWRPLFHTWEEFEHAPPLKFAIEGWLQAEGITMFGGLPGHGKTWVGMATAKALLTGEPLFGYDPFKVTPAKRVLYLCPEVGLGPLTYRLKKFRLDPFVKSGQLLYRSLSKDPVPIIDPRILRAAEGADVFLDTATRFMEGEENSATDQKIFASNLFLLLKAGARSVVGLHHSAKSSARDSYLSLENALRGSGDIGAMLSTAWGFRQTDAATNTIHVANIKPRDFEPCAPFTLQGRPWIDDTGNFKLLDPPGQAPQLKARSGRPSSIAGKEEKIRELLKAGKSYQEVADAVACSKGAIRRLALADGLLGLNKKAEARGIKPGFSWHKPQGAAVPVKRKRSVSKPHARKRRPKR